MEILLGFQEAISANQGILIAEIVVGVLVSALILWIKIENDRFLKKFETKNSFLLQQVQYANQIKFSINSEEIKAMIECYDKYFVWYEELYDWHLDTDYESENEREAIIVSRREFTKSIHRLEMWCFDDAERVLKIRHIQQCTLGLNGLMLELVKSYQGQFNNVELNDDDLEEFKAKIKEKLNIEFDKIMDEIVNFKSEMSAEIRKMVEE